MRNGKLVEYWFDSFILRTRAPISGHHGRWSDCRRIGSRLRDRGVQSSPTYSRSADHCQRHPRHQVVWRGRRDRRARSHPAFRHRARCRNGLLYYLTSRRLTFLVSRAVLCGLIYGALVYLFMHLVVVPLSATPKGPTHFIYQAFEFVEHWFCVGLPIAL